MIPWKKILFVLLSVAAIGIWLYNISIFVNNHPGTTKAAESIPAPLILPVQHPAWKPDGKDPFYCREFMGEYHKRPLYGVVKTNTLSNTPVPQLAGYKIGGIVFDSNNPMAIIQKDGQSTMVKRNDSLGLYKVYKIGKDTITLLYNGRKFYLVKGVQ